MKCIACFAVGVSIVGMAVVGCSDSGNSGGGGTTSSSSSSKSSASSTSGTGTGTSTATGTASATSSGTGTATSSSSGEPPVLFACGPALMCDAHTQFCFEHNGAVLSYSCEDHAPCPQLATVACSCIDCGTMPPLNGCVDDVGTTINCGGG